VATDDIQRLVTGSAPAPAQFTIPGNGQMQPKTIFASYDGTGAGSPFIPALKITSDGGKLVGVYAATTTVAAGGSADVSWFPWRRITAGTPAPSPNPLGTLWAWWDFSDASSLSIDGSGKISAIADKTGLGHNLSQLIAAQRPSQSVLNGLGAGLFNSTPYTALISPEWADPLAQPYTICCVNTQTNGPAGSYLPGPFGAIGSDAGPVLFSNPTGDHIIMLTFSTNISVGLPTPYTKHQFTCIYDGVSSHLRLDQVDTAGTVDVNRMTSTSVGAQHFPQRPTLDEALDGQIGEVLIYSGHLTAAQLSAVESYLKTKWGTP
jgi:hypothetical protein